MAFKGGGMAFKGGGMAFKGGGKGGGMAFKGGGTKRSSDTADFIAHASRTRHKEMRLQGGLRVRNFEGGDEAQEKEGEEEDEEHAPNLFPTRREKAAATASAARKAPRKSLAGQQQQAVKRDDRKPNKPRRIPAGQGALKEIRALQNGKKAIEKCIRKAPFIRLVREIDQDLPYQDHRFEKEALDALQEAAEAYLSGMFELVNRNAIHAKRTTIDPKDVHLWCINHKVPWPTTLMTMTDAPAYWGTLTRAPRAAKVADNSDDDDDAY